MDVNGLTEFFEKFFQCVTYIKINLMGCYILDLLYRKVLNI